MCFVRALLLLLLAALTSSAQFTERWTHPVTTLRPHNIELMQGESRALEITLHDHTQTITLHNHTATFFWQTPTMGATWWQSPATIADPTNAIVSYLWTPAHDTGAPFYTWFIQLTNTNTTALTYRLYGRITLRTSPGHTPNSLPLPTPTIDFATVQVLNPPWPTLNTITACCDAATASLVTTQQLADAVAGIELPPSDRIITPDRSRWIDATGGVWAVESVQGNGLKYTWGADVWADEYLYEGPPLEASPVYVFEGQPWPVVQSPGGGVWEFRTNEVRYYRDPYVSPSRWAITSGDGQLLFLTLSPKNEFVGQGGGTFVQTAQWTAVVTNHVDTLATLHDLSSRVAVLNGHATNLTTHGWLALPQKTATNLIMRLVASNEYIIAEEVYQ